MMPVERNHYFITARLIDVEKASVAATADAPEPTTDLASLQSVSKQIAALLLKDVAKKKSGAAKERVAVYVTGASENTGKVLGAKLVSAITNSDKYAAMERTSAFVKDENRYQQSGNVADSEIAQVGRQLGVRYVCVAKASRSSFGGNILTLRLINVETAEVTASISDALTNEDFNSLVTISAKLAKVLLEGKLEDDFTVDAMLIDKPARDGVVGTITNTDGSDYKVRSMGGTWWMIENADKPVGCTNHYGQQEVIDKGSYGHLYYRGCAEMACPSGWTLPSEEDFKALSKWLTANGKWDEWNSGFALAGSTKEGTATKEGSWWCKRFQNRATTDKYWPWRIKSGETSGGFLFALNSRWLYSVRCIKKQ
jgi:uncharacterized protein (TIGR02145 family)